MSATAAPESEHTSPPDQHIDDLLNITNDAQTPQLDDETDVDTRPQHDITGNDRESAATVKVEDVAEADAIETATTLRPDPQPSTRRRESAAAEYTATPEFLEKGPKKRKRAVSPPWQFGTVEQAALKTADGRRISARVNTGTPLASESEGAGKDEGRVRSASQSTRSRPPSPPWKKFAAEGPTTVQVDGMRKSGRVNKELTQGPKRTSPRQKKMADKMAVEESQSSARPISRGKSIAQVDGADDRPPSRRESKAVREQSPASRIRALKAQIAALQPTRSFPSPDEDLDAKPPPAHAAATSHKRNHGTDVKHEQTRPRRPSPPTSIRKPHRPSNSHPAPAAASMSPAAARPSPRIKLRFNTTRHLIPPPHPNAQTSPPAKPPKLSLYQICEKYELEEMQHPYMDNERGPPGLEFFKTKSERLAVEEGTMRKRLLEATAPGQALSREECSMFKDERQPEPPQQFSHMDHLVAHALWLRNLQQKERNSHRIMAKKVAYEALEYWKSMRGPTEEDLIAEQDRIFKLIYKQVVVDVRAKWEMVEKHVQQLRKERWEAEEDAKRQERLQRQLEQAEAMVAKQRGDDEESDIDMEAEDSNGEGLGSETSDEEGGESEEENMSQSESEAGSGEEAEEKEMSPEAVERYKEFMGMNAEPPDRADGARGGHDQDDVEEEDNATLPGAEGPSSPAGSKSAAPTLAIGTEGAANGIAPSTAALLAGDDDQEEEEEQEEYQPDDEGQGADVAMEEGSQLALLSNDVHRRSRQSTSVGPAAAEEEDGLDLSEDESVEMYDSDEDMSSSDDEDDAGSDDGSDGEESGADKQERAETSMLGFILGPKNIKDAIGLPTPTTSAEGDARDRTAEPVSDDNAEVQAEGGAAELEPAVQDEVVLAAAKNGAETVVLPEREPSPPASPRPVDSIGPTSAPRSLSPDASSAAGLKQLTPVPALLRGTLRSYQHAGLDWLASLHRNGTNGILADEMGLGKTIQTIAVLAHLAEEKQIWEPHLVIVPTSVILNWVTEFHKFLPGFRVLGYYGNAEERMIKRKGWVNDPHHENREKRGYNVVVTSYNVAMQDINAIRNVQWHYLVLDEAHNIRNFNSQRWQVLIRLRTKARLLLTGTPLQNSLTELWSLLTFLTAGDDDPAHGDLEEFLSHWKEPVKEIFDRGVSALSTEAQKVVDQLHVSLRPFLLRRLKSEVEKDLPKKTESVVVCKLSKRQRQLYQEYMGLASTRQSLANGNAVSAGKVLLSLRRVCNHPDLFDPRPIQTSYAMEQSPVEPFGVKEGLVRRLLGETGNSVPASLMVAAREGRKRSAIKRSKQLAATGMLQREITELERIPSHAYDPSTPAGCLALQRVRQREKKLQHLRDCIQFTKASLENVPAYGSDLRELLTVRCGQPYTVTRRGRTPQDTVRFKRGLPALGSRPLQFDNRSDWLLAQETSLQKDVLTLDRLAEDMQDIITRFAFCTPVATAPVLNHAIPARPQQLLRASDAYPITSDYAHEARSRTSIVFPDSRLLIYDSGKLQRLTKLLRELQAKGSRSLIFTQMTGTLNILEQFLNLLGLPYLRLDGSTPPEKRMIYASEFNRPDSRYQCMILSSRAGGVGLNLTGASSVIFYDLDWNPQMDRQCMDRAHRIGQVRDVEVFKMVSEKTVEENILRRANQKSLLDQTVIQEGHFTTEYQQTATAAAGEDAGEGGDDDLAGAIERFLGGGDKATTQAIASVEDREDVAAAEAARKEENQDAEEFAERSSKGASAAATPAPGAGVILDDGDGEQDSKGHVDGWMIRYLEEYMLAGVPFVPPPVRRLDKHGRDPSHRPKRKR